MTPDETIQSRPFVLTASIACVVLVVVAYRLTDEPTTFDRAWLAGAIAAALFWIWLACSRRAVVAWLTYFSLRRHPKYRTPEGRAYLLALTLRYANGDDLHENAKE